MRMLRLPKKMNIRAPGTTLDQSMFEFSCQLFTHVLAHHRSHPYRALYMMVWVYKKLHEYFAIECANNNVSYFKFTVTGEYFYYPVCLSEIIIQLFESISNEYWQQKRSVQFDPIT